MHSNTSFNLKNISKIEGHTHLDVKVENGKVTECKLKISENKRFFSTAIIDKDYNAVPQIMSRICGTCSSAHAICSTEAIENALNLKVSKQTSILRDLLVNSGHLRDHAMHLYFFCLPDIYNKDSVLDFKTKEEKDILHDGLHVKEAGNFLSTIIGGRAVHPPNTVIGGFTAFPTKDQIKEAKEKLIDARPRILKIIDIFYKSPDKFERDINYTGLISPDYNFLKGEIQTIKGTVIPEKNYADHLDKVILPYSTATAFTWESKDFMVGALARLNINKKSLHPNTIKDTKKYLEIFPSDNIFHNNLAQAIEMLHQVDISLDQLTDLEKNLKKENLIQPQPLTQDVTGTGVIEAPRGTLYYKLEIKKDGKIKSVELCIPTQQNIIHMQTGIAMYIEELLKKNTPKNKISLEIEKMIRAYDPCMSCATHFLKINWI